MHIKTSSIVIEACSQYTSVSIVTSGWYIWWHCGKSPSFLQEALIRKRLKPVICGLPHFTDTFWMTILIIFICWAVGLLLSYLSKYKTHAHMKQYFCHSIYRNTIFTVRGNQFCTHTFKPLASHNMVFIARYT